MAHCRALSPKAKNEIKEEEKGERMKATKETYLQTFDTATLGKRCVCATLDLRLTNR